ncbi:MAG: hypothetical protein NZ772_15980 [Cyanobacteria bacterium]|nr:hypothetical protein [Cyanobacteriota bacterium]MDW8202837.1 hypothetical protein [Cyanobacteriota bacterium SKYGB_h_bin112]
MTSLIQEPLLATSHVKLFSNELYTGFEKTRTALEQLHKRYPSAVIYAPRSQLVYDAPAWLRVSMADSNNFWQAAYTSRPMRLIMASFDICTWRCVPPTVIERLATQSGFQMLHEFPDEFTRVFMVELPAGYKFSS